MARTPSYIRLADHIAVHGSRHDLRSGFGISGFDVVKWPEGAQAQKFAKSMLNKGIFEEASKAEYDEVVASNPELGEGTQKVVLVPARQAIPEHRLRERIETAGQKVAKRVQSRLEEAEEADEDGLLGEDPNNVDDDELAGDAQRPTKREKVKGKKGTAKASRKNDEGESSE